MAQILVKTPVTSNGRDVIIDPSGKVVYKETILEASARPEIEKKNTKLPPVLRKIIETYNPVPDNNVEDKAYDQPVKVTKNVKAK